MGASTIPLYSSQPPIRAATMGSIQMDEMPFLRFTIAFSMVAESSVDLSSVIFSPLYVVIENLVLKARSELHGFAGKDDERF
jgi:hypothetical protein